MLLQPSDPAPSAPGPPSDGDGDGDAAALEYLANLSCVKASSASNDKTPMQYCNTRTSHNYQSTGPLGAIPSRYSVSGVSRLHVTTDVRQYNAADPLLFTVLVTCLRVDDFSTQSWELEKSYADFRDLNANVCHISAECIID